MIKAETNTKPILAIETSNELCSVCSYFSNNKYYSVDFLLKNSHSEILFELVDFVLKRSNSKLKDYECIAVSAGPGSFTGLRIGIAAAKGLALGSDLPIALIPTFDAAAFQVAKYLNPDSSIVITSKVNNDDLYFAKYKTTGTGAILETEMEIISHSELEFKAEGSTVYGNVSLNFVKQKLALPNALFIAKWLINFGQGLITKNYDFLEPNYFKMFTVKERKK